ncbi:hypothetical protein PUN28_001737 [Cardiocondyla obscurior]
MILDVRLLEESCLSNIMIIDLEGFTMAHYAKVTPTHSIIRQAMLAVQDSMPFRLAGVYFVHVPTFITNLINVFYPFLKEKLTQKFYFFHNPEELYAHMDKDILPSEWGGKGGTFQELNAAWQEKLEKNRDWFLRDEKLSRTNEKARLMELKSSCLVMELEGIQGSFRQLNID